MQVCKSSFIQCQLLQNDTQSSQRFKIFFNILLIYKHRPFKFMFFCCIVLGVEHFLTLLLDLITCLDISYDEGKTISVINTIFIIET